MSKHTTTSAQDNATTFSSKKRTIALIIVALAFVMDLLDSTIVNIAIPSIRTNLTASYSAIQWVVAGYSLAFSVLLITGGRMGDVFGYKKLFMIGVSGFTLASLLSGVAQDPNTLIAARILQGAMAALMVPQVMSLMQVMYKPNERASINAVFGGLGGLAASLGPVIGGLLIKANLFNWSWRPIFLINVPIGLLGLFAAAKYLPSGKSSHPLKLDFTGTFLIIGALFLLAYPLIQGRDVGWPAWAFIMMICSLPIFLIFAWWQKRREKLDGSPLILPSLFEDRSFGFGLAINMLFQMALVGYLLVFTLLLQIGFGFSAIHAALTGLPVAVGVVLVMASLSEKVIPKLGRYSLSLGAIIMASGLGITAWLVHRYSSAVHSWQFIPGLTLVGMGMGFVFGALIAAVLNGVDPKNAGSASGALNAVQQVGAAISVALIGVIFFGQLSHSATNSFASIEPSLRSTFSAQHIPVNAQNIIIQQAKTCFVDRSKEKDSSVIPPSCQQTSTVRINASLEQAIGSKSQQANAINFDTAFSWSIIFAVALLVVTFGLTMTLPAHFRVEAYNEI